MDEQIFDIAIIGGGSSGLSAAIAAAQSAKVAVIERLPRVGKKILSTGNGRCNLSNADIDISCYCGDTELIDMTRAFDAKEFFEQMGLVTKTDKSGRIYPYSMTASSVLDALRYTADSLGAKFICDSKAEKIYKSGEIFVIYTSDGEIRSKAVVLAAGGSAAPSMGTDGSGFALARSLGHSVTKTYPALAPLRTDIKLVKALKGLRVYAAASLIIDGKKALTRTGEVQFADGALSGICIFDLSLLAAEYVGRCSVSLDLAPDIDDIFSAVSDMAKRRAALPCGELLTGLFHKRIGQQIMRALPDITDSTPISTLTNRHISKLCSVIKDMRFPVIGLSDYSLAQASLGGVPANEIGAGLSSKKAEGLFLCGEVLNICGFCGGYNLDWAWRSGCTAGLSAAEYVMGI